MKQKHIITVDGPAVSGKGSLARALAQAYGYYYIETGLLYRAVGYCARRAAGSDRSKLAALLTPENTAAWVAACTYRYTGGESSVSVDGVDITAELRTPDIDWYASQGSALPTVRQALMNLQRELGAAHGAVIDGRDCGTVIFPHAAHKFFLIAPLEVRVNRLFADPRRHAAGYTREQIRSEIFLRDIRDVSRAHSPLIPAADAHIIDNGALTPAETVAVCREIIEKARC